jgi:hypothetical protein
MLARWTLIGWLLVAAAPLAAMSGCAAVQRSPAGPTGSLDATLTLRPGELTSVPGTGVRLRFDEVLGDSRCPSDVVCVWEGYAELAISVVTGAGTEGFSLRTQPAASRVVTSGGLTIELLRLDPHPVSDRRIDRSAYRATLRVTR